MSAIQLLNKRVVVTMKEGRGPFGGGQFLGTLEGLTQANGEEGGYLVATSPFGVVVEAAKVDVQSIKAA